ncbi:hypothetical protein E4V01_00445 [Methylorubrum sp. Q1]|uniref:hypothetical protein n=1 Tax=Methylorubrum sp. Q1 TaxID=2562453 RepID=UPI00107601BD|nr:hypothetical protein [Methylorubrum sp. Q1]TFZ61117.1 hypothetical protein E4V01_00445 [Methylorubrum sp. Q1]
MSDEPSNIKAFEVIVGHALSQLYLKFPEPVEIDGSPIAQDLGVEVVERDLGLGRIHYEYGPLSDGRSFFSLWQASLLWLRDEGFIRSGGRDFVTTAVLTKEALIVMNKFPEGLSHQKTIGTQITEAAKGSGKAAGTTVMGELVGQIIGGVTKSFLG